MKEECQSYLKEMFMSRNCPRQSITIWERLTLLLGNVSATGRFGLVTNHLIRAGLAPLGNGLERLGRRDASSLSMCFTSTEKLVPFVASFLLCFSSPLWINSQCFQFHLLSEKKKDTGEENLLNKLRC